MDISDPNRQPWTILKVSIQFSQGPSETIYDVRGFGNQVIYHCLNNDHPLSSLSAFSGGCGLQDINQCHQKCLKSFFMSHIFFQMAARPVFQLQQVAKSIFRTGRLAAWPCTWD